MMYLLNSPVLTAYGDWRYEGPIDVGQARQMLADGFMSAIGHPETAQFLTVLLGIEIPENRISIEMKVGDSALVLRLTQRLQVGQVLRPDELDSINYQLSHLRRLA